VRFVNVAVVREERILLTRREDFDVWCLPGGHVEPGEPLVAAAHREVREETGLEIRIERLVGMYSRPRWLDGTYHLALFGATVAGGRLEPQPSEVLELAFFARDEIPADLLVGQRERIRDAFSGGSGLARSSPVVFPFPSVEAAREARDDSELSRREFYAEHIALPNASLELVAEDELGPTGR
jgi:ADP-ribose pyrophosphatase YjhB (NUDIX family)